MLESCRRSRKKTGKVEGADEVDVRDEKEGTEMKTLRPINRCMFEGLYPRGPAVDYDFLLARRMLTCLLSI